MNDRAGAARATRGGAAELRADLGAAAGAAMSKTKGESLVNRWISIEYGECLPTLQVANEGPFCVRQSCV